MYTTDLVIFIFLMGALYQTALLVHSSRAIGLVLGGEAVL